MSQIFIKPAVEGHLIRHPEKMDFKIPPEGCWVEDSLIWQRYLKFGDVVLATPPEEKRQEKNSPKQTSNKVEGE